MDLNSQASPYIVGPPVSGPDYFYGHCHQINQFFNVLRGRTLQSRRVLGLRRSGKTSFLLHVAHPEVAGPALEGNSHPTVIAYVNLQIGIETPSDFYLTVADAIAGCIPSDARPKVPDTFPTFRSFFKWLELVLALPGRLRLVVLLDEFEVLTRSPGFELPFFHSLRSLVTARFMWVTATSSDLYTLFQQARVKDRASPFFNVFHPTPIIIGPLESEETEKLICEPAKSSGVNFLPEEIQAIQDIAGAIPYFLQAAAEEWFFARKSNLLVDQCRKEVLAQLLDPLSLIRNQLSSYWQDLTVQEQDCLRQAALGKLSRGANPDVEQRLVRYGLLCQDNGNLKVAGEVFRQWIINYYSERSRQMPTPPDIAPFVPIIVEATKFVFNEASKWIEDIRKQTLAKATPPKTTLGLPPSTEAQLSKEPVDMQAVAEMMDSSAAEMKADEIEGLVEQIRIHHKHLIRLQTKKTKYSIDVPVTVEQQIDDESESIAEKTARLVKLLNEVYQG